MRTLSRLVPRITFKSVGPVRAPRSSDVNQEREAQSSRFAQVYRATRRMFSGEEQTWSTSPSMLASSSLHRRLSLVLAIVRTRLRRRLMAVLLAVGSMGATIFSLFLLAAEGGVGHMPTVAEVSLFFVLVSGVTGAALYPILFQWERQLIHAASTISHHDIDLLSVLGKLTELSDGETAGHNMRVTTYTLLFAESLGLPPEEIWRTTKGALLHDIGKLAVTDLVLGKPGALTPEERKIMETHVNLGLEIIAQSKMLSDAASVVGSHHEHYDGAGYPLGLKGEAIPREARVFALVDVFDALTSARVYKPALSVEDALATMDQGRGSHFDPVLLDHFVDIAPAMAKQLPRDDVALTAMLMERLLPYVDQLANPEPGTAALPAAFAFTRIKCA